MTTTEFPLATDDTSDIPSELRQAADQVAQGQRPAVTVRVLLSWFYGSQRRGRWIVSVIRRACDRLELKTEPDFDSTYIDGQVTFVPKTEVKRVVAAATVPIEVIGSVSADATLVAPESVAVTAERTPVDPTHRIGRLEIANRPPVSVSPDTTIAETITIMLMNDFSQLPVMTSDREVKGLFSWKSLGSLWSQGRKCTRAGDAMDRHSEIDVEASLFAAIDLLRQDDCVLVRDRQKRISGIITSYDVSVTFSGLSEPFLILDEIENHIRRLIEGNFSKDELSNARDPGDLERRVEDVSDLSLGECMRLIERPGSWEKLHLQIDRAMFIKGLDEIRRIRNDVMHFDPEGTDESDLKKLRDFVGFLQRLQRLGSDRK
jgi:predicted transcriptional regulator